MATFQNILLTGSIGIDRIMNFKGSYKDLIKPEKIHVLSLSILIDKLENSHGGIAANIAYSLSMLGDHPILLGTVGQDAKKYMDILKENGVDTGHVKYSDKPTSTFTVLTDQDDNQIGGFYPGAMEDNKNLSLSEWKDQNILVVISANDPQAMRNFVSQCKEYNLKYVYDVSQQVNNISGQDISAGIEGAYIVIVNDYEREVMAQKINLQSIKLAKIPPIFITTLGSKGSIIEGSDLNSPIKIPSVKPSSVVDPTGAGDAFRAGFLHGFSRGGSLKKCGQIGSLLASYAIEKQGTQVHTFTKAQFNLKLSNNFNQTI